MTERQAVQNVVALRLGRVDIIAGFAKLEFLSIDDVVIEPAICMPVETLADTILKLTRAGAIMAMGDADLAFN